MARTPVLLLALLLAGCGTTPAPSPAPAARGEWTAPSRSVSRAPLSEPPRITYPAVGGSEYRTAKAQPGRGGLRYRVLVETDIEGLVVDDFAATVSSTLDDPRGWSAAGRRFHRAGPGQPYDFTIYLATPRTRDVLCASAGDGYTSCRNGDKVVLNVARWAKGVPGYGASLSVYRQYMVNHEVGHRLGHGHELCPADGEPAPVMQQQTLGLHGCTANPWPYLKGKRYAGTSGVYNDPAPGPDRGRR